MSRPIDNNRLTIGRWSGNYAITPQREYLMSGLDINQAWDFTIALILIGFVLLNPLGAVAASVAYFSVSSMGQVIRQLND